MSCPVKGILADVLSTNLRLMSFRPSACFANVYLPCCLFLAFCVLVLSLADEARGEIRF